MAQHTYVVLACDVCDVEHSDDNPVQPHTLAVDRRKARKVDACASCWSPVQQVADAGTRPRA